MLAKDNSKRHFVLQNIDVVKNKKQHASRNNNTHRQIIFQIEFFNLAKEKVKCSL